MRSINRQYYRILFITIRPACGRNNVTIACYCRYASSQLRAAIAASKCIARHGYAGVVGTVTITRKLANITLSSDYALNQHATCNELSSVAA